MKPCLIMVEENLANHCLEACFNPYIDFCNFQTCCLDLEWEQLSLLLAKPGGKAIETSSLSSPWRNALLTSNRVREQPLTVVMAKRTLTVVNLATGEKVYE